jgi:hypothetical protein
MKFNFKEKVNDFLNDSKDYPILVGFFSGFYPLVYYYSNNYESINSYQHLLYFIFLFLVLPCAGVYTLYKIFRHFKKLNGYKRHLLFVLAIEITAVFLSQVYYLTIKKKILLLLLILVVYLSSKFYNYYKNIVIFLILLSVIPFYKTLHIFIYKQFNDTLSWTKQDDDIEKVKFVKFPNIYFLEPDGYVGKQVMEDHPYKYNNSMYDWLESNSFIVYKDTRSNYPASLASNASMFAMKHHHLNSILSSPFEMQDSRSIIVGNNPVIKILKNNNYKTFFIVEDGYFQQSFPKGNYDYFNIMNSEIPFFSNDNNAKRDVYEDLKKCLEANNNNDKPKFYFVEKLLPHHIIYDGSGIKNGRKVYLEKIEIANDWLIKTIELITKKDPQGIIIIGADHGGWVGIENINEMFTTRNPKLLQSIFGNLIAIKWNDDKHHNYDENLKSNVNIFRVLFSYLSEDRALLQHLEKDSSYNLYQDGVFSKTGVKVID